MGVLPGTGSSPQGCASGRSGGWAATPGQQECPGVPPPPGPVTSHPTLSLLLPRVLTPLLVGRFNSLQPHAERLDVSFFVGGPVWAMEWCPSPEGSAAAQYVAVYCHGSMEETHSVAGLHGGPALLQLWGLGALQQEPG